MPTGKDRQTDRWTADRYIAPFALDAASSITTQRHVGSHPTVEVVRSRPGLIRLNLNHDTSAQICAIHGIQ